MRINDTGMSGQREPALSAAEAEHSERVRAHIAAQIAAAGGWLGFERYMDLALYAPGLGYYCAGTHKFGPDGDFTTAPELSGLFGACVAGQCAPVLAELAGGSILEIGAGSGRLAGDILAGLERAGQLPDRYWILDVSADLRERQRRYLQQRLPHLTGRIEWLDAPPAADFDGVILANEVLDALPVTRFRWTSAQVQELGVAAEAGQFAWSPRTADAALAAACRALHAASGADWPEGYVSEYCPRLAAWTASVTRPLRAGAVFWFDYGLPRAQYYFPERQDGTLLCHFRQRAHADPFRCPGLEDITAWVDFTRLAEAGTEAGFSVGGFTTQTYFLAGAGIDRAMRDAADGDDKKSARLAQEARQLMLPGGMGESFKAMLWSRGLDLHLSGFALRDLRHVL
jgi:SAM-dependent MidA family methyltransferase